MMERRDFLKAGAVAGGSVGLGALGCGAVMEGLSAVPVPSVDELLSLDMDGFLRHMDTSLGFIRSSSTLDGVVPRDVQAGARQDPRLARSEELVRSTLRSLLLVGSFGDLPEAGRMHPGVQSRMWSSLQEMNDSVVGMNQLLTSFTPTERADVSRLMREDPTAAPRVLGALDDEAVKAGVNDKRRTHMREVGKHAVFRMRQSTTLFIDEYDDKVKKVGARDSSVDSFQRRIMAQMGEKAFWDFHARQFALAQAWQHVPGIAQAGPPGAGTVPPNAAGGAPPPGTLPPPGSATAPVYPYPYASGSAPAYPYPYAPGGAPPYPYPPGSVSAYPSVSPYEDPNVEVDENGRNLRQLRKGNILLGVGGGLLGLGAIMGGISVALVSNPSTQIGGYGAITAAAVLGLGGIGCLIAGGIIRARA
jgi:hypothetical protein